MPRYDYRCLDCGATWEEDYPIAERDYPVQKGFCPVCQDVGSPIERYLPSAPGVSYSAGDNNVRKKTPESFKDVLRHIKSKHRGSTIDV